MANNLFLSPQVTSPQLNLGLNILDIIDVISDDKDFVETEMSEYAGGGASSDTASVSSSIITRIDPEIEQKRKAYVQIVEQPQPKALRFRYICEGRSAGSIPGVRSTAENKTFPTIKIMNYKGPAVVVVSCVTVDPPYRPHPHNLVGKEGCSKGVCTVTIDNDSMEYSFSNLGIQCVKKRDVDQALKLREEIRVDPFGTGFSHRSQPQSIDLNSVRLCFQVFLNSGKGGRFTFPLKAVVSEPIYDKKATSDLNICKLSDCTSCVSGGKEIILLCDKVTKEDIQVRFFEVKDGHVEWEGFGDFQASDVHKQFAICFKTPKYKDIQVDHSVKVYVQLFRPSDKSTSEPRPFEYLPLDAGRPFSSFKRLKNNYGLFHRILGLESPLTLLEDVLPHKIPTNQISLSTALNSNYASVAKTVTSSNVAQSNNNEEEPQMSKSMGTIISNTQSVDVIKERMKSNLDKNKLPYNTVNHNMLPVNSPLWNDDTTTYSDVDILDEVLSQGSVNDLLSAVGDGFAVYEDVDIFSRKITDEASCYSNVDIVGRSNPLPSPPVLPPKNSSTDDIDADNNFAIYGMPSSLPIHPNKEALLRERGFLLNARASPQGGNQNELYYSPVSDILEVEEELESQAKEIRNEGIPQTILDLFV